MRSTLPPQAALARAVAAKVPTGGLHHALATAQPVPIQAASTQAPGPSRRPAAAPRPLACRRVPASGGRFGEGPHRVGT